jgi:DNA-binding transcriptional MerR regulator
MIHNRLFIGKLAKQVGVNPRTIRYYEAVGLLPQAPRGENRYRLYPKETIDLLQFIAKAKALGFRLTEIKEIVGMRWQGRQPCSHVQGLVEQKVADLDLMLTDLTALRKRLKRLLESWKQRQKHHGSEAVVCPHIEGERLQRMSQKRRGGGHRRARNR